MDRREYLTKHKVQSAIASATAAAILKRCDAPCTAIGHVLLDPSFVIAEGSAKGILATDYAETHNITTTIAHAVLKVAETQPEDPIAAIGRLLVNDNASISEALSKGLQNRSSADELAQRNILKGPPSVSGVLHSAQAELEKKMAASNVEKGLARRMSGNELVERNILKASPEKAHGSVQSAQAELEKKMAASAVEKGLAKRSSVTELAEKNILKASPDKAHGALHGAQAELEKKMTATAVEKSLQKRSSIAELEQRNILLGASDPVSVEPSATLPTVLKVYAPNVYPFPPIK